MPKSAIWIVAICTVFTVICGCRVTTPQPTLRDGACWFPPTFPYLHGRYQAPPSSPNVHYRTHCVSTQSSLPIDYRLESLEDDSSDGEESTVPASKQARANFNGSPHLSW